MPQEKEKRGFRDKLGFGHSSKASHDASAAAAASKHAGLGRSLSVSKKRESQVPEHFYTKQGPSQGPIDGRSPYRRSANSSQILLNTHAEEDEDSHAQHNVYAQQRYDAPPPPPAKEPQYEREHRYSQQPAPPQAYYKDPRSQLTRVQTGDFAPQGQPTQADPRSPVAQSWYQDQEAREQQDSFVHAYQPGEEEAAPGTPYHNSPDDAARYSYSQQPPAYSQHGRIPSGPPTQSELHYPQPGPGRASLEKYNRPPSQPQGPPGGSHEQRQDANNALFLQAPARGASLEAPPSPLVPAGPSANAQKAPLPPPSPQPPSTTESAQSSLDSMPQSSRSQGNNTIRSVGQEKSAGSRESSGMQAPPPVPPHKQGVAAYGANVVPAGSQGAPFRGQAAAAVAAAGGQKGRDSPAPEAQMAPVELVDEEAASYLQLQKEYKELREFSIHIEHMMTR